MIWKYPKVTLISKQVFLYPEHINWKSDSNKDADVISEFAGRSCYLSYGKDCGIEGHKTLTGRTNNEEYLNNIKKQQHFSVLEHAVFGFLLEGVSRSYTHEQVRHRVGVGYSQLSQRFVDETNVGFVLPPAIKEDTPSYKHWEDFCKLALRQYALQIKLLQAQYPDAPVKKIREAARSVLPNCTETKIVITGNARIWRHILLLRGSSHAEAEMQRIMPLILNHLKEYAPNIFSDLIINEQGNIEQVEV